jgi:hypothetical protein
MSQVLVNRVVFPPFGLLDGGKAPGEHDYHYYCQELLYHRKNYSLPGLLLLFAKQFSCPETGAAIDANLVAAAGIFAKATAAVAAALYRGMNTGTP